MDECAKALLKCIDDRNVLEIAKVALVRNRSELRNAAINYAVDNWNKSVKALFERAGNRRELAEVHEETRRRWQAETEEKDALEKKAKARSSKRPGGDDASQSDARKLARNN